MKAILTAAALLLAASSVGSSGSAMAQGPEDPTSKPKEIRALGAPVTDLENEKTIRELYADYTAAWNRHDPKAMASFWAIDGDYMEPDGRHAKGRADVEKLFTLEQQTVFKDSKLALLIETVFFVSHDVALVDGKYDLVGVRDVEGKEIAARQGHLTALLMREDGTWKVAAGRAMIPVPLVYRAQ